jgi:hypothetical protein
MGCLNAEVSPLLTHEPPSLQTPEVAGDGFPAGPDHVRENLAENSVDWSAFASTDFLFSKAARRAKPAMKMRHLHQEIDADVGWTWAAILVYFDPESPYPSPSRFRPLSGEDR